MDFDLNPWIWTPQSVHFWGHFWSIFGVTFGGVPGEVVGAYGGFLLKRGAKRGPDFDQKRGPKSDQK